MNFALELLAGPEIEPVTLAEAKIHLRAYADITTHDDYIESLISVAREMVEDYTGRALIDQTWRLTLGDAAYPSRDTVSDSTYASGSCNWSVQGGIMLRRSPVLSVTSMSSIDSDGADTAISDGNYQLRDAGTKWPRLVGSDASTWGTGSLKIEFRAGFANRLSSPVQGPEMVPAVFKHAIKLIVGHFYNNRESVTDAKLAELPMGVQALLSGQQCNLGLA